MISIDLQIKSSKDGKNKIILNEAIKHIFKAKKTAVLTGAGISCNAGIPDFRSADGLYNLVKTKFPEIKTIVKGQDLFDISLFRNDQSLSLFCTFMESLYNSTKSAKPTETHKFIKILKDRNKLLRCYTQNIDSLESHINLNVGINLAEFNQHSNFNQNWKDLDVIQLHGNLHKLSCTQCFANFNWTLEYQKLLGQGLNPECSNCYAKYEERLYSGKRLTGNIGMLRPDIVLYGENHPQSEILAQGLNNDLKLKPDLLIIMGTSLKVDGVKKLVKTLATSIHAKGGKVVFVNKTSLAKQWENYIDYEILCDCDQFIKIMKIEVPDLFLTQEQLDSKKLKNNFNKPVTQVGNSLKNSQLEEILKSMIKNELENEPETDIDEEIPTTAFKQEDKTYVKMEKTNSKIKSEPKPKSEPKSKSIKSKTTKVKSNTAKTTRVKTEQKVKMEPKAEPKDTGPKKNGVKAKTIIDPKLNLEKVPISKVRMTRSKSVTPPLNESTTTNHITTKPTKSIKPTKATTVAKLSRARSKSTKSTIPIKSNKPMIKQEPASILTPPTTPTKHKRPVLTRNLKRTRSQVCNLPSPATSFAEDDEILEIKQDDFDKSPFKLPLKSLTGSQLNMIKIPKKPKVPDNPIENDDLYSRKRIKS